MTTDFKKGLPKEPEPMTAFTPKAWLRPRRILDFGGGSLPSVIPRINERLRQELTLATDEQLRELSLMDMRRYRQVMIHDEARRRGLKR